MFGIWLYRVMRLDTKWSRCRVHEYFVPYIRCLCVYLIIFGADHNDSPDRSGVYVQCSCSVQAVYTVHRLHRLCSVDCSVLYTAREVYTPATLLGLQCTLLYTAGTLHFGLGADALSRVVSGSTFRDSYNLTSAMSKYFLYPVSTKLRKRGI